MSKSFVNKYLGNKIASSIGIFGASISLNLITLPTQAATLGTQVVGSFDLVTDTVPNLEGSATFSFEKTVEGFGFLTISEGFFGDGVTFFIGDGTKDEETGELSFIFNGGTFSGNINSGIGLGAGLSVPPTFEDANFLVTNLEARHEIVPESSTILGILTLGTLGAVSTLKRKIGGRC